MFEVGVLAAAGGGAGGDLVHFFDVVFAVGDEGFDEVGFGEIFPILLGHLGLHGFDLEAGGVEDAFVVAAPEVIELLFGDFDFFDAGTVAEGFAIPGGGAGGGEDGPVHAGETLLEKVGGEGHDLVVGFEPSHELFAAGGGVFAGFLEADEGVHFVDVAPDFFAHFMEARGGGVGGDFEEVFFAAVGESPEGEVEDGPPVGGAVVGDVLGEGEEFLGDGGGGDFWWREGLV